METRERPFHFLFHAERHVFLVVLITAGGASLVGKQAGGETQGRAVLPGEARSADGQFLHFITFSSGSHPEGRARYKN